MDVTIKALQIFTVFFMKRYLFDRNCIDRLVDTMLN